MIGIYFFTFHGEVIMLFKLISFRRGNILDFGEAETADEIKKFVADRPNADAFHAHPPKDSHLDFFITGMRIARKAMLWQKVRYTVNERQFA